MASGPSDSNTVKSAATGMPPWTDFITKMTRPVGQFFLNRVDSSQAVSGNVRWQINKIPQVPISISNWAWLAVLADTTSKPQFRSAASRSASLSRSKLKERITLRSMFVVLMAQPSCLLAGVQLGNPVGHVGREQISARKEANSSARTRRRIKNCRHCGAMPIAASPLPCVGNELLNY
jgi:hypothetical protein